MACTGLLGKMLISTSLAEGAAAGSNSTSPFRSTPAPGSIPLASSSARVMAMPVVNR